MHRSGVIFPVRRIHRLLKNRNFNKKRVATGAAIYLAAVLEYLTSEVLDLAGNVARDNQKKRITPRFILLAIKCDSELDKLWSKVIIPEAGTMPIITTYIPLKIKQK